MFLISDIPNDYCLRSFKQIEEQYTVEYKKHKDIAMKEALK